MERRRGETVKGQDRCSSVFTRPNIAYTFSRALPTVSWGVLFCGVFVVADAQAGCNLHLQSSTVFGYFESETYGRRGVYTQAAQATVDNLLLAAASV